MSTLKLRLDGDKKEFLPASSLSGVVEWTDVSTDDTINVTLLWYTSGRGTEHIELCDAVVELTDRHTGTSQFSFQLPPFPYSFSGKLITVTWAVEARTTRDATFVRLEFVMAPEGKEIHL